MMRDFLFGLVKLLQPCADGLSHNAVQRCGLMQRSFAIGRLRHADTVLVPPVPSTEDAPRSASRQAGTSPRAEIEVGRDRRLVRHLTKGRISFLSTAGWPKGASPERDCHG